MTRAAEENRLRRRRHVEQVCRLHIVRLWVEFVDEVARHYPEIADDLDRRLVRFAALDPAVLVAVGGDRLPVPPLRAVG
jgi:hypothetical protein